MYLTFKQSATVRVCWSEKSRHDKYKVEKP